MGAARRLTVAAVGVVALATVGGAALSGARPEHVDRRGLPRARGALPRLGPAHASRRWPATRDPSAQKPRA